MKLSDAEENENLEVTDIQSDIQDRLRAMGVFEGCAICPLLCSNDNTVIEVQGCRYAISKDLADCIIVKRL